MLTGQNEWTKQDNELWLEFVNEERSRREEHGHAYQRGYAEGIRVGLSVAGKPEEGFFK